MEENLKRYEDLSILMEKIDESMKLSEKKSEEIDEEEISLYVESKPMIVDEKKETMEKMKQDKAEFDEMTKNAIINAKREALLIRKESEKKYEEALVETMQKQNEIQEKLNKMRSRYSSQEENDIESLKMAESAAENAMENVKEAMNNMQKDHFGRISKLDEYESKLSQYAVELNMADELDKVEINNEDIEKAEVEDEKQEAEKAEQTQETKAIEDEKQEEKTEPTQGEEVKEETSKANNTIEQVQASVIASKLEQQKPTQENVVVNKAEQQKPTQQNVVVNKAEWQKPQQANGIVNRPEEKAEASKPENEKSDKESIKGEIILDAFTEIEINAKEGKLKIFFPDEKMNKEIPLKEIIENRKQLYSRVELRKKVSNYCKNMNYGILKEWSLMKDINPAIITAIDLYGTGTDYEEYLDALASKYSGMPFNVKYDLKNSTMDPKDFRLMNKFAKNDKELYGVTAEGIERNWLEKIMDRIKNVKLLGKGKEPEQLEESQNSQKEQRKSFIKEQEIDKETKEKMEQVMEQYKEEQNNIKEAANNTHTIDNSEESKNDTENKKDEDEVSL